MKDPQSDQPPVCLQKKINEFDSPSLCNDAKVDQYEFQSKTVFTFDPGSCGADMTTEVLDADCNRFGYLGGISGNTKINGEDFSKATFIKTIWKK
jgi:hypothetical protein